MFLLTRLLPFPVFKGKLKRSPGLLPFPVFKGKLKSLKYQALDLCVVAISSLYALQAMRLVGGLTGVRRRNQRFLTYRLIIQLDTAIQVEDEVVCCWVGFFCCCWAGGGCVFDKAELHAHFVVNFVKDGWVFCQEFLSIF